MNINNIALVRATNIIPLDGVIKPLSNVPYLTKNISLPFSFAMSDLLNEIGIIPKADESKMFDDDYYDQMVALSSKILKEYLPYVSDYNSMVLFALNGLCPDDNEHGFANNTFSNKKCAIIEPLVNHINETISLVPTDTAIKGDVYLSNEAIVLIEEEIFNNLDQTQRNRLLANNYTIRLFTGSLKEAVENELKNSNRYIPETLSLSSSSGGIMDSATSEEHKALISSIANEYQLSQKKYFNLLTGKDETEFKYEETKNEYENTQLVLEYFTELFLQELLPTINAPQYMMEDIKEKLYNKEYYNKIKELIKIFGIENYKNFIDQYNYRLKEEQINQTLITPQETVDEIKGRKISKN